MNPLPGGYLGLPLCGRSTRYIITYKMIIDLFELIFFNERDWQGDKRYFRELEIK